MHSLGGKYDKILTLKFALFKCINLDNFSKGICL